MNDRIRILQIIGNARLGGVASCLLNYLAAADRSEFCFDFATYGESPFDDAARKIEPETRIHAIPRLDRHPVAAMRTIKKICLENDYAAVHSHMTTLSALALPPAASAGVPLRICHAHSAFDKNSDHYTVKKLLRPFAAAKANKLMACSRHAAENLFGKRAGEAYILPDAIDLSRFACTDEGRDAVRQALGINGRLILFVGRFAYQKNLSFLLKAFREGLKTKDMTLALVGDGAEKETLKSLAVSLGIENRVRIVPPCDPAPWYKAADVFCLPSRYEGLGMVAIEAQAAGTPCILSDKVPEEADVSGGCTFLPAETERDAALWGAEMAKDAPRIRDARQKAADAGYDIGREAHNLTDFYRTALKELHIL